MKIRQLALVSLLALFTACTGPFPYSPQFVDTTDVPPQSIVAPPAKGSPEFNHELDLVVQRQKHLSASEKDVIAKEAHIRPEMIVLPVLGGQYTEANYPKLYLLLKHAASDAWRISDNTEDYYQSPRPWYTDERVKLFVPAIHTPGYPSGHTTTNSVWAYILSELFPEKHDALFNRAITIGSHRIDGGAHFPHDVTGGRQLASVIYSKMKLNPDFQEELAAARAELAAKQH